MNKCCFKSFLRKRKLTMQCDKCRGGSGEHPQDVTTRSNPECDSEEAFPEEAIIELVS